MTRNIQFSNARGGVANKTALDHAASKGHLDIAKFLLSLGAEIDLSEPERNPLFAAIYGGHLAVAELLIKSGLDPHVTYVGSSGQPKNALAFANERGQKVIAEFLVAAGCSLPSRDGSQVDGEEAHWQLVSAVADEFGEVSQFALQEIVPVDLPRRLRLLGLLQFGLFVGIHALPAWPIEGAKSFRTAVIPTVVWWVYRPRTTFGSVGSVVKRVRCRTVPVLATSVTID